MAIISSRPYEAPSLSVRFQKGFKTDLHFYQPRIDMFARRFGHQTTVRNLIDPGDDLNFMDEDQARTEEFFTFPFKPEEEDIPKIAGVHSLSGYFLTRMLMDDDKAEAFANQGYEAIFMFNPHAGNRHHESYTRRAYSSLFSKRQVGTTPLERALARKTALHGAAEANYGENLPYHGQALLLYHKGVELIKDLKANDGLSRAVSHIPVFVVSGAADDVNSKKNEKALAELIGAKRKTFNTGHNAFIDSTEAQSWYALTAAQITNTVMHAREFNIHGPPPPEFN